MAKSYRKFIAGAATAAVVASSFAGVAGAASFSDVNSDTTHQEGILALVDAGIIKGYEDGTFRPYASITRGEAAIMTARALGILDGKNIPANPFKDVSENQVAYEAIVKLAKKGIVSGFTNDTFKPYETVTRGQVAKYVALAYGYEPADGITKFPDVNENAALAPYVDILADAGIIEGKANGNFGYNDALRRADFSGIVHRAEQAKIKPDVKKAVKITAADDKGNKLTNGDSKTYTVKVTNPNAPDQPVAGATVNITFKENLNTNGKPQNNIGITNNDNSFTVPYQANDGTEAVVEITTDQDGEATFTVTGANGTVTPIAYLDGSNQEWDTKGGIKIETQDDRFDPKYEYYDEFTPVTFAAAEYKITVTGERTKYAAIGDTNGRKYNVVVTKPDGTPYTGKVNVGILELEDDNPSNNLTKAYYVSNKNRVKHLDLELDRNGKTNFTLYSDVENDTATPVVWIDSSYSDNAQDHKLETGEPASKDVEYTNFQKAYVEKGTGAKLEVINVDERSKGFNFTLLNQSGKPFLPSWGTIDDKDARVTYTVKNEGANPVLINTYWLGNIAASAGHDYSGDPNSGVFKIEAGGQLTIAGDILDIEQWFGDNNNYVITATSVGGDSKVKVSASAVVDGALFNEESQSVAVSAPEVTESLTGSKWGDTDFRTQDIEYRDSWDDNGNDPDTLVITFDDKVYDFEEEDFRLYFADGSYVNPSNVDYDVESTNINKDKEDTLVLTFSDQDIAAAESINYDGAHGDADVYLIDSRGNVVKPVSVVLP